MNGWTDGWMDGQRLLFISNKATEAPAGVILLSLLWAPWHQCRGQQWPQFSFLSSQGVDGRCQHSTNCGAGDTSYIRTEGIVSFPTKFTSGCLLACSLVITGAVQWKAWTLLQHVEADTTLSLGLHCHGKVVFQGPSSA